MTGSLRGAGRPQGPDKFSPPRPKNGRHSGETLSAGILSGLHLYGRNAKKRVDLTRARVIYTLPRWDVMQMHYNTA